jgi:hypothetical protein
MSFIIPNLITARWLTLTNPDLDVLEHGWPWAPVGKTHEFSIVLYDKNYMSTRCT